MITKHFIMSTSTAQVSASGTVDVANFYGVDLKYVVLQVVSWFVFLCLSKIFFNPLKHSWQKMGGILLKSLVLTDIFYIFVRVAFHLIYKDRIHLESSLDGKSAEFLLIMALVVLAFIIVSFVLPAVFFFRLRSKEIGLYKTVTCFVIYYFIGFILNVIFDNSYLSNIFKVIKDAL